MYNIHLREHACIVEFTMHDVVVCHTIHNVRMYNAYIYNVLNMCFQMI